MTKCDKCGSIHNKNHACFDKYGEVISWWVECAECGELLDED
jgi:ribosomal protein L32